MYYNVLLKSPNMKIKMRNKLSLIKTELYDPIQL